MCDASDPSLTIQSHRGPYHVHFESQTFCTLQDGAPEGRHFIVDARVAKLYSRELQAVLSSRSVLLIEATEQAKSLDHCSAYIEHLVSRGIRRDHRLIAIGGGVIQDIVAFVASTLLRGVDWEFHPTTLLAQADSCIGSKSSINVGQLKNIVGTFWPPQSIHISPTVQATLDDADIRSGIGEMLKVHAIDSPESFDAIAADYERLQIDSRVMQSYVRRSLEIKQRLIESDEFDHGARLVMNYGHSFGHAIETATNFGVPHGIAVTIGMDMANFVSNRLGRLDSGRFRTMHTILSRNSRDFAEVSIPMNEFYRALGNDKKNRGDRLTLILPDRMCKIERVEVENDGLFRQTCAEYLLSARNE